MPITLSKIKHGTRSIVHFEALEQTLRLRLVSGHADKKFFKNQILLNLVYGMSAGIASPFMFISMRHISHSMLGHRSTVSLSGLEKTVNAFTVFSQVY
jgi:hypothetical protein